MRYFPAFFDLRDRPSLVVGGGLAAARKARLLHSAGAAVTIVAARPEPTVEALAAEESVTIKRRGFVSGDARAQALVVAATGDAETDERVAEAARAAGVPVNVVDRPELCTFTVPAFVDRDPVIVAISTGGDAPVLGQQLREQIERLLPARIGELARLAGRFRAAVSAVIPSFVGRRRFWSEFFRGPLAEQVLAGRSAGAAEAMLGLINRPRAAKPQGRVDIVGAGPGNPDLLTLRALQLLQQADVVLYDRLVGPDILGYARRDAACVSVGKARGSHALSQADINALMIRHARAGARVVRLKGGDPFIFGRGGEELQALREAGIAHAIVPGITAATGCAAIAGIPLTHRDLAHGAVLVTGQGQDGEPDLDWAALAKLQQTLVVYMGLATAGSLTARLIGHGYPPATPVAVIENGTLPQQRAVFGRLAALPDILRANAIEAPALIIIGEVVRLADAWTEDGAMAAEARLSA